jgi:hypothetical protein
VRVDDVELLTEGVTGLGLKDGVTPVMVDDERVTGVLKLLRDPTVMVEVTLEPMGSFMEVGDAVIVKSGISGMAGMLRVRVVL